VEWKDGMNAAAPRTDLFAAGSSGPAHAFGRPLATHLTSLVSGKRARTLVWVLAILLPIGVAVSRLYRGMHFPTDVAASVLFSIAALLCALLVVRTMAAVAAERDLRATSPPPADSPPEVVL
jgi:undecaprenyl-diphosphatase